MLTVNVHEAKTTLSDLIARAEAGEDIVIARANKPVVRLVAIALRRDRRVLGLNASPGFVLADDFDAPMSDEDAWYRDERASARAPLPVEQKVARDRKRSVK